MPGCSDIRNAIELGWLRVKRVLATNQARILALDLDRGESEAIALALQVKADWLLVDERDARKVCKELGLKVTGILGIILKAWRNGKIPLLKDVMDELIYKAGFRISDELYQSILKEGPENSN